MHDDTFSRPNGRVLATGRVTNTTPPAPEPTWPNEAELAECLFYARWGYFPGSRADDDKLMPDFHEHARRILYAHALVVEATPHERPR